MNRQLFVLAVFSIAVAAKNGRGNGLSKDDEARFVKFAAENNKNFKSTEELHNREKNWKQSDDFIKQFNDSQAQKGKKNGVKLGHNLTSDMTDDEFKAMLGLQAEDSEAMGKRIALDDEDFKPGKGKGRKLYDSIDHAKLGNMVPVKNQLDCGSCWAFTANSVLEGTIAAQSGKAPVALSEQELVDCTTHTYDNYVKFGTTYRTGGCRGGWYFYGWNFTRDQGSTTAAAYPYKYTSNANGWTATGMPTHLCSQDEKVMANKSAKVTSYGQVVGSLQNIKDKLKQGPLGIAVASNNYEFRYYKEGVMDGLSEAGACNPDALDHAVTLVGFSDETEPQVTETEKMEYQCTTIPFTYSYSCNLVPVITTTETVGVPHWKVQNSWGSWWGQDGFVLMEQQGGKGVCGMNQIIFWVQPDLNAYI